MPRYPHFNCVLTSSSLIVITFLSTGQSIMFHTYSSCIVITTSLTPLHFLSALLSQRFSPSFRSDEMRKRLSDGHVDAPLLIYVGRIGAEKKLHRLKKGIEIMCELLYLVTQGKIQAV